MKTFVYQAALAMIWASQVLAQSTMLGTTAFTYQGQLRDNGTNANGSYTMVFKLYDSATTGNQLGGPITTTATLVNGLFTVNLDFGAVFNGSDRWLDITVQSGADSEKLSPRVQVLPSPYSQFAYAAGTIASYSETLVGTNVVSVANWNAQPIVGDVSNDFAFSDNGDDYLILRTNGDVSFSGNVSSQGVFYGDGSGLTNVSAIPRMKVFDTPGTYTFTVPTNVTGVMVELWGGGGGGGSSSYIDAIGETIYGSGGGAGGYGKGVIDVTSGETLNVTVGMGGNADDNGGTSSVDDGSNNALISATGGDSATTNYMDTYYDFVSVPGTGGSSTGPIHIAGGSGTVAGSEVVINGTGTGSPVISGGSGGNAGCGGFGGIGDLGFGNGAGAGQSPGGGGGGGIFDDYYAGPFGVYDAGGSGGNGQVVVYY